MVQLKKKICDGRLVVPVVIVLVSGCRVNGNWSTETVDPPGTPFPLEKLALDPNRNYAALWTESGKEKGSYGQYVWNGYQLKVAQSGREPRIYGARIGLNGKLMLTYRENGQRVTATLRRQPAAAVPVDTSSTQPGAAGAPEIKHDDRSPASPQPNPRRASQPR